MVVHAAGGAVYKTSGKERRPNSFKGWQRGHQKGGNNHHVIKSTCKPTVGAVLGATVDQVASKLIEMRNNRADALPPNPHIVLPDIVQVGTGRKRHREIEYKKANKRNNYSSTQRPICYNF